MKPPRFLYCDPGTIDDAVEFAMNAPDPAPEDAATDLYA